MNETKTAYVDERERLRRWRLILGKDAEDSLGKLGKSLNPEESEEQEKSKESKETEESEKSGKSKEAEETEETQETKETEESGKSKEAKGSKKSKITITKEAEKSEKSKEAEEAKKQKESEEAEEAEKQKESEETKEAEKPKESKESEKSKEPKESGQTSKRGNSKKQGSHEKSDKRDKSDNSNETLSEDEIIDYALQQIYGGDGSYSRQGSLDDSSPRVQRWLGDIRTYFPKSVVQVVQKDAFDRLGLKQLLLEPELLETLEVDVNLVATIISLSKVIPGKTKQTARIVVQKLVDELMKRLESKTLAAVRGALNRAARTNRPRQGELDFDGTIRRNLKNWDVERQKLIADRFVGYARRRRSLREVVLCVDQSGSMGRSVVYSSIFGAVLASVPAIKTRLVFFDTSVADMTERLTDPVDVMFGAQLGGGTDINGALKYCQSRITQPKKTTLVLITDLFEGGNVKHMFARVEELIRSGVKFVCLTALDDEGSPSYDASNAQKLASLGVPAFACTPDLFPDLMATALNCGDVARWAGRNNATTR